MHTNVHSAEKYIEYCECFCPLQNSHWLLIISAKVLWGGIWSNSIFGVWLKCCCTASLYEQNHSLLLFYHTRKAFLPYRDHNIQEAILEVDTKSDRILLVDFPDTQYLPLATAYTHPREHIIFMHWPHTHTYIILLVCVHLQYASHKESHRDTLVFLLDNSGWSF